MKTTYIQVLKNTLAVLFAAIAFASCRPNDIEIDLPEHEPKLSIFSQVIPDQVILVTVTKSFNSLEPSDSLRGDSTFINQLMVSNAVVTVKFAGKTEVLHNSSPGIYLSTNVLQVPNEQYTLEVYDPATGLTCSATSTMLQKVSFDDAKTTTDITSFDTTINLEYSLTDEPGKDNYYLVTYTPFNKRNPTRNNPFLSINPPLNNFQLLSDKLFTSNQYSGKLELNAAQGDTVAVSLANISEEYYKYLAVYQKSGRVFNQITGEPIDFPTNVKNGYGFFTTHNPDVRVLKL